MARPVSAGRGRAAPARAALPAARVASALLTTALLAVFLATTSLARPAAASSAGLSKPERLRELLAVHERVERDPALEALRRGTDLRDRHAVDRWLTAWPLSPLAELELDMHLRRYELAVPRFVFELHQRWLALHPEEGRRLYGDAAVDRAISGIAVGSGPGAEPEPAAGEGSGTGEGGENPDAPVLGINRNVAEGDSPAPFEYQGEVQLAVDPRDPRRIVAAANTWDDRGGTCGAFGMQAVFYSGNRGATWDYTCAPAEGAYGLNCTGAPLNGLGTFGSDPAVAWDDAGNVYLEYMLLCAVTSLDIRFAVVVARSTNGGANWSARGIVKNSWATGALEDKNFYAIDNFPTSPFHGRHYTCWDRNNNEKFAYSTTAGQSWTEVDLPAPGAGNADLGCDIAIEDDGTVHVAFNRLTCSGASCSDEDMYSTRSLEGGASWSSPVHVYDFRLAGFSGDQYPPAQDERGISNFGSIDVDNSGGPCRGTLYVTFTDIPAGGTVAGANIYAARSTTNGASWSAPVLVNDDAASGGRTQFHPFLVVDRATRHAVVAWHDARNDSTNDQRVDYYIARSADCGLSFGLNLKLSAASAEFNNSGISYTNENSGANANVNPNQFGEYLGLDVYGGRAFVAWTDSRHFFPGSTAETQVENLGFVELRYDQIFFDGFGTGDTRVWSSRVP